MATVEPTMTAVQDAALAGPALEVPALEVRGVAKRFGGLVALRDVSFRVRQGEVMGLIGPNGAGKSTLFEIISGNLAPSAGQVLYFGEDCTALPVHRRRRAGLCRTFQKVRLFDTLTVRENIAVATRQSLPPGGDWQAEVESVLERLRLGKQADRLPAQITLRIARRSRSAARSPGIAVCCCWTRACPG